MLYRSFGQTGKKLSAISFGGMRFAQPQDLDSSAELLLHAYQHGINYFDTAPVYCNDRSEDIFGRALAQLPRDNVYISSKCSRKSGDELRMSLERSLTRLQLDKLDFYYIWCLMDDEDWQERKRGGAVAAAQQAQEEGLIDHLLCSSHMQGNGLAKVLNEGIFAGVLLGYNALNFPYRRAAVEQAEELNLGVITMNPLGGGIIPGNAERFAYLKNGPEDTIVNAALRFNLSHPAVTSALVGFSNQTEITEAVAAADTFRPSDPEEYQRLLAHNESAFAGLCTGCGYCLPCPVAIPIPKFMDVYNQKILSQQADEAVFNRFRWHWGLQADQAAHCTRCGLCEQRCTQRLPITERLAELAQ